MLKKDIFYYALIKGITVLFWVILLKLNAVYLEPTEFANFTISLNIGILLAVIITGWQSAAFMRYYHEEENKSVLYSIVLKETSKVFIFYIFIFLIILLISFLYEKYFFILLNGFIVSLSYATFLIITIFWRIKRELKQYLFFTLFFSLVSLIVYFILINKLGWMSGLISISISYIGIFIYMYIKKVNNIKLIFNISFPEKIKIELIKYGVPIVLIGLSSQIMSTIDVLLLKLYGFEYEAGIYSANYSVAEKSIFAILSIMASAFTPIIFKNSNQEGFDIFSEIKEITKLFLFISLPLVIIISYFSKEISLLLLDRKYFEGFYIIPYIAFSGIFMGIANFYSEVLTVKKSTYLLAKLYLSLTIFNITMNILLIPFFTMNATVITTFFTYLILMIVIIFFAKRSIYK